MDFAAQPGQSEGLPRWSGQPKGQKAIRLKLKVVDAEKGKKSIYRA